MTVSMALWNLLLTPLFLKVDQDKIVKLLPVIIMFNIIKSTVNSIVALFVYKAVNKYI
jgi:riboflavin transporter FmnP